MRIEPNHLTKDVGLKFDNQVILGIEEVTDFIESNQSCFEEMDLKPLQGSHMLYGYNSLGYAVKIGYQDSHIQRIIISSKAPKYKRMKAIIAYDGFQYNGFQIQDKQKTIQGELSEIISSVNNEKTNVHGASRTDTGVHANYYVCHFDSKRKFSEDTWKELLNHRLPNDIFVKSMEETHPLFHSRYDVFMKRYVYRIRIGDRNPLKIKYEWAIKDLDINLIQQNLDMLMGTHDFSSFCKGHPDDTVRTIYRAEMVRNGDEIELIFEGNGFLRHMIRIIVYAVVQIATRKHQLSIADIMNEKNRNHTKHMAPACGLYLDYIEY